MKRVLWLLPLVLVLAACSTVGALLNPPPDPRLGENLLDVNRLIVADPNQADAAANALALKRAKDLAAEAAGKKSGIPGFLDAAGHDLQSSGNPWLALGGTAIVAVGGAVAAWLNKRTTDKHAARLDAHDAQIAATPGGAPGKTG